MSESRIVCFIAALFIVALAGCDDGDSDSDTSSGDTNATADMAIDTAPPPMPSCGDLTPPAGSATEIDFATSIQPVLEASCAVGGCHVTNAAQFAANLDLSEFVTGTGPIPTGDSGPLFVACDPAASNVVMATSSACDRAGVISEMPLVATVPALTEDDKWAIVQWIAEGGDFTYDAASCP